MPNFSANDTVVIFNEMYVIYVLIKSALLFSQVTISLIQSLLKILSWNYSCELHMPNEK